MKIVGFLEEPSTKEVLNVLVPKIVPGIEFQPVPFSGRGALESGLRTKLIRWNDPDVKFVVVEDQDSANCIDRKSKLQKIVDETDKDVLIRIVCRELESWYFGDLLAVEKAYGIDGLAKNAKKAKYRNPDAIKNPKEEFKRLVKGHQQILGAQKIAPYMDIDANTSKSFQAFVSGIRRICL